MQLEGCFIIMAPYLNRKKNRRFSSKFVLRHIFFQKNFVENFFKDRDSSKFTGGARQRGGLDSVEYGISFQNKNDSCLFKIHNQHADLVLLLYRFRSMFRRRK